MRKQDLRTGDILILRCGYYMIYDIDRTCVYNLHNGQLNDDLTNNGFAGDSYDVVKVIRGERGETKDSLSDLFYTVWERPKAKEMTLKQISEILGYEVEIIKE